MVPESLSGLVVGERWELPAARTWLTADTHVGHDDVASYFERPFSSLASHDERIRRELNARVEPGDTLVHLGDVGAGRLCDVPGVRQILVRGNHDDALTVRDSEWDEIHSYLECEIGGQLVVMFHYPLVAWRDDWQGAIHLHGHTHGRVPDERRGRGGRIDLSVDVWNYAPMRWRQILERLRGLKDGQSSWRQHVR